MRRAMACLEIHVAHEQSVAEKRNKSRGVGGGRNAVLQGSKLGVQFGGDVKRDRQQAQAGWGRCSPASAEPSLISGACLALPQE